MTDTHFATIEKNTRESLRVTLDEFKGHRPINMRVWFKANDGEMRPGNSGIAIKIEKLEDLLSALAKAQSDARAAGWLP
jgi:Transcriptional Coactivator p15 (PC4)